MKRFVKYVGFATAERDREIEGSILRILKKAYAINRKIFRKPIPKFRIIICDTEGDFMRKSGHHYQKWSTATVLRNGNLITRSPDFIERVGKWRRTDFPNIMNHELNHVFWKALYHHIKPIWLMEGLACHIGNNFILGRGELKHLIRKYRVDSSILEYRYLKRNFDSGHYPRYPVWANFTMYIVKKYSVRRTIRFMERYSAKPFKENYKGTFKKTFGKTGKELFNEFLCWL